MSEKIDDLRRTVVWSLTTWFANSIPATTRAQSRFLVFDALLHKGKPNLSNDGFIQLPAVAQIWRPQASKDAVDEAGVIAALAKIPVANRTIFYDIEIWPVHRVSDEIRDASIRNFLRVAQITQERRPHLQFGFYGVPPVIVYWPIILRDDPGHRSEYPEWQAANRALTSVANAVHAIFPSLYTFYDDLPGWLTYADAQIREARSYGKPVYPFLWFEFHDSNPKLKDREIPGEFWAEQIRFCRKYADGIVFWGGAQRVWSGGARWWRIALAELGIQNPYN